MHVIGDQAIEVALETIEKVMRKNAEQYRPRLEHWCFKRGFNSEDQEFRRSSCYSTAFYMGTR
jgi:hypothetical protein